jgi:hypothetical protein
MKGTVIKRGSTYSVVFDLGRGPDGKRIRKWHPGYRTKKLAEAAQIALAAKLKDGGYVDPSALTMAGLFDRVFDYLESIGRDARTVERHRELARLHVTPTLGGVRVQQLTSMHLSELYARLLREGHRDGRGGGLSPRTVGHVHRTVHRALRQAVRWRLLAVNPAADLELPTVTAPGSRSTRIRRDACSPRSSRRRRGCGCSWCSASRSAAAAASCSHCAGPTSTWRRAPSAWAGRRASWASGSR